MAYKDDWGSERSRTGDFGIATASWITGAVLKEIRIRQATTRAIAKRT